jgi:hypothetical protein
MGDSPTEQILAAFILRMLERWCLSQQPEWREHRKDEKAAASRVAYIR